MQDTTTQIYLQITMDDDTSISGESMAGGYEGRIDIDSFDFAAKSKAQSLKEAAGIKTASKLDSDPVSNLDFDPVSVTKVFDRSSLQLARAMKDRRNFKEAVISVDQQYVNPSWSGKRANEILILSLYNGYITDITLRTSDASSGAEIRETVKLSFHNFQILYYSEVRAEAGSVGEAKLLTDWRPTQSVYKTSRKVQEA